MYSPEQIGVQIHQHSHLSMTSHTHVMGVYVILGIVSSANKSMYGNERGLSICALIF